MNDRDGEVLRHYKEAHSRYFACAWPRERASVVIDNADPANPSAIHPAAARAAH